LVSEKRQRIISPLSQLKTFGALKLAS